MSLKPFDPCVSAAPKETFCRVLHGVFPRSAASHSRTGRKTGRGFGDATAKRAPANRSLFWGSSAAEAGSGTAGRTRPPEGVVKKSRSLPNAPAQGHGFWMSALRGEPKLSIPPRLRSVQRGCFPRFPGDNKSAHRPGLNGFQGSAATAGHAFPGIVHPFSLMASVFPEPNLPGRQRPQTDWPWEQATSANPSSPRMLEGRRAEPRR